MCLFINFPEKEKPGGRKIVAMSEMKRRRRRIRSVSSRRMNTRQEISTLKKRQISCASPAHHFFFFFPLPLRRVMLETFNRQDEFTSSKRTNTRPRIIVVVVVLLLFFALNILSNKLFRVTKGRRYFSTDYNMVSGKKTVKYCHLVCLQEKIDRSTESDTKIAI